MAYEQILLEKREGIATLTLNRPAQLNAVTRAMNDEIKAAIAQVDQDPEARVLVITGAGRAFCAGIDLREAAEGRDLTRSYEGAILPRMAGGLDLALRNLDKPTIAAVNGHAVGMGCDLALACDLRVASDRAVFWEAYVQRGMVPSAGPYYLPRLVGLARAFEMLLTGDPVDAATAERIGLVNRTVPQAQLSEATEELARKLAKVSPLATKFTKRAVYVGQEADLKATLDYVTHARAIMGHTEDGKEGVRAFAEKREPRFTGR